jgi:PAS domain S-box-containing protein
MEIDKKILELLKENWEEYLYDEKRICVILSKEGKIIFVNEAFLNLTLYDRDIIGKDYFELFIDNNEKVKELFNNIINGNLTRSHTNYIYRKDKKKILIKWTNFLLKSKNQIYGTISFGEDITAADEYYRDIKTISNKLINLFPEPERNIKELVELAYKISGADCCFYNIYRGDYIETSCRFGVYEELPYTFPSKDSLCEKVIKSGEMEFETILDFENELINRLKLKKYHSVVIIVNGIRYGSLCFFYSDKDKYIKQERIFLISSAIAKEEEKRLFINDLKNERNRYKNFFDNIPFGVSIFSVKDKEIVYVNEALNKIIGNFEKNITLDKLIDFIYRDDKNTFSEYLNNKRFNIPFKLRFVKNENQIAHIEITFIPYLNEKKELVYIDILFRDITSDIYYSENINFYTKKLLLISQIDEIFIKASREEIYDKILDLFLNLTKSEYGYIGFIDEEFNLITKAMSNNVYSKCKIEDKIIHRTLKESNAIWAKAIREGKIFFINESKKVPNGHIKIENAIGIPILNKTQAFGVIMLSNSKSPYKEKDINLIQSILEHISDRMVSLIENEKLKEKEIKMQEYMLKTEKLQAINTLASGIAHDFNNLLSSISSNLSLLKEEIKDKNRDLIDEVIKVADSASELSKRFMAFSKSDVSFNKEIIDSNGFFKEIFEFLLKGFKAQFKIDIEPNLKNIEADRTRLTQVFSNIVKNAIEAVSKNSKPFINISVSNYFNSADLSNLSSGDYIKISIEDNGVGMDEETLKRAFEPYFTRKSFGNGLGLYSSYNIIKSYKGYIDIESVLNKGTKFIIYLPATDKLPVKDKKEDIEVKIEKLNVLILDDNEIIIKPLSRIIEFLGLNVYSAKNSSQAREIANKNKIDIAFIDLILNDGVDGAKFNLELKKNRPEIYTVVSSGYSDNNELTNYREYKFDNILPKPYKLEDVKRILIEYQKSKK